MKKIIITGANGFVGSRLVKKLMQTKEYYPVALVRKSSSIDLLPGNADIQYINYYDREFENLISEANIVIHIAGLTKALAWKQFESTNINLTKRVVQLCNLSDKVEQLIFISSQAAAGPSKPKTAINEETTCKPLTQYGKSKKIAEDYVRSNSSKAWTILRPVSVFGPGDKDFLQFFKLIQKHVSIYIGQTKKVFNLIYIDDLTDLIVKTLDNPKAFNQIFFATTKTPIELSEMVEYSQEIMEKFSVPIIIPIFILKIIAFVSHLTGRIFKFVPILNLEKVKEFKEIYWVADYTKASIELDFESQVNLFNGIYKTVKWYREKGWLR